LSPNLRDVQHLSLALETLLDQLSKLLDPKLRPNQAFLVRVKAALFQRNNFFFDHPRNNDEQLYANRNYIGSYTKALKKHNNDTGEVDPSAYLDYLKALQTITVR